MIFRETEIAGVVEIGLQPHRDNRGFFARTYCPDEIAKACLAFMPQQMNLSRNERVFTLRGMHWQDAPQAEAKIVRVSRGAIFDVVVDLRREEPTFGRWIGRTLDAEAGNALFIPEGCAHGFLTLEPATDVFYLMGRMFESGHAKGFRYDDPEVGIVWPHAPDVIAPQDLNWPSFEAATRI